MHRTSGTDPWQEDNLGSWAISREYVAAARAARTGAADNTPPSRASIVSNAAYRHNAHDGSIERIGGASVQMAPAASQGEAILASARTAHGSRIAADKIDDNAIVKFGGTEGRVKDAIAAGFLRRDEAGRIV